MENVKLRLIFVVRHRTLVNFEKAQPLFGLVNDMTELLNEPDYPTLTEATNIHCTTVIVQQTLHNLTRTIL
jgi:hypothetical protein